MRIHGELALRGQGATVHSSWVARVARNLVMNLEDAGAPIRYLIREIVMESSVPGRTNAVRAGIKH